MSEPSGYTDDGVPTFEHVRDTIEGRAATAIGAEELAAATPEVRTLAEQEADRAQAGADKLEEIRRSLRGEGPGAPTGDGAGDGAGRSGTSTTTGS